MGGNAFEGTVRLTASEHRRVTQLVMDALTHPSIAPTLHVIASAEILEKSSFGDVDLYAAPRPGFDPAQVRHHMTNLVATTLRSAAPPVRNGRTLSFLSAERYQVDVAFTEFAKLALYATVHSNGDFAVLLQISLTSVGLRLTTEGFFLRDESLVGNEVSKWDASFLLSLDPKDVGEFLGLPREAFDGRTSLAMSHLFALVVENRWFDGGAVSAWTDCENRGIQGRGKARRARMRVRERPMVARFREWWRATGVARYGDRRPAQQWGSHSGARELAVSFFNKGLDFVAWEGTVKLKVEEAALLKVCKSSLNFALVKSWLPGWSSAEIGEVLRKIRAEHGESGSAELANWVRGLSQEDVRTAVLAVARQLDMEQHSVR